MHNSTDPDCPIKISRVLKRWLALSLCCTMLILPSGCGPTDAAKTQEPAQVEQKRKEHQDTMQKEMTGS